MLTDKEVGIAKLLQNKGLPIFHRDTADVCQDPASCELLAAVPDWKEIEVKHSSIKQLKKQSKKIQQQMEK